MITTFVDQTQPSFFNLVACGIGPAGKNAHQVKNRIVVFQTNTLQVIVRIYNPLVSLGSHP